MNCADVDRLMTTFVDEEIAPADRASVEAHLERCPPCRRRASAEASSRLIVRSRAAGLREGATIQAPLDLRARCVAAARSPEAQASAHVEARSRNALVGRSLSVGAGRLVAAAVVTLAVAGMVGLVLTRSSSTVMAAQLTADHVKCYKLFLPDAAIAGDTHAVEARVAEQCGWPVQIPGARPDLHLTLVGARRCLFGDGRVAHVMYMHGKTPISLFIVPEGGWDDRALEIFGHQARIWSRDGRTYVLIGREDVAEIRQVAQYAQSVAH